VEIPTQIYQQQAAKRFAMLESEIVLLMAQVEMLTQANADLLNQLRVSDASDELETPLSDLELDDGTKVDTPQPVPPSNEPEEA
jgi:hypothetical protein